jgi:hypothetical protein
MTIYIDNVSVSQTSTVSLRDADLGGDLYVAGRKQFKVIAEHHINLTPNYNNTFASLPSLRVKAKEGALLLFVGHASYLSPVFPPNTSNWSYATVNMPDVSGLLRLGPTQVTHYTLQHNDTSLAVHEPMSWMFPCICTANIDTDISLTRDFNYSTDQFANLSQMVIEL